MMFISIFNKYFNHIFIILFNKLYIFLSFFTHIYKIKIVDNNITINESIISILFIKLINFIFPYYNDKKYNLIKVKYFNGVSFKNILLNNYQISLINNKNNHDFYKLDLQHNLIIKLVKVDNINLTKQFIKYNNSNIQNILLLKKINYNDDSILYIEYLKNFKKYNKNYKINDVLNININDLFSE